MEHLEMIETTITLETIDDLATVVHNWQQDILMVLEEANEDASTIAESRAYAHAIELLSTLPFKTEYSINLVAMNPMEQEYDYL